MTRNRFLFWLDALLLLTVVFLQTPRTTGLVSHEWGGIVFAGVVALHLLLNWSWIVSTVRRVRRPHSWRARVNLLLNAGLFAIVILALLSGLMISEEVISVIGLERSRVPAWGTLHIASSTIALVIVGFHIALNWDWILGVVRTGLLTRRSQAESLPRVLDWHEVADEDSIHSHVPRRDTKIAPVPTLRLGHLATVLQRLLALAILTVTVSAGCFALVELTVPRLGSVGLGRRSVEGGTVALQGLSWSAPIVYGTFNLQPRRGTERAKEGAAIFLRETSTAFLAMGAAAVIGRSVLRLRLRSVPSS
jgi:hypothetical protein